MQKQYKNPNAVSGLKAYHASLTPAQRTARAKRAKEARDKKYVYVPREEYNRLLAYWNKNHA